MGSITGRWATVLMICMAVPTLITHLLDGARLVTIAVRTCVAAVGAFLIGFVAEWRFSLIRAQKDRSQPPRGQHLDLKVGPAAEEQVSILDVVSGDQHGSDH